ncbi:MAG TPA: aldolase/citrate lyase family protein [Leptospiraceae bacterium]|nr:aldolase/citrate lyase family protein [Leptospiraceae bacterium]HMX32760.1 aldolase/citrate lyase family protein [Leptospiraceae bacterium]HMY33848.1 aldolase/citrate lyase family protein [Leptospiraceae bacterium]HMZ66949.1 aldolase/citrate lyase family protein [Leptospiraceae bacterium]HNA07775.1 aldolase/citrate lyase family protein [Leptospiraceae bacterium]
MYVKDYCFTGLKGGTETEDMDYDELKLLSLLGRDLVPVIVKIGGPEARTDIRFCKANGIDGISAPMIESQYALKNFISTLKNLIPPAQYESVHKSMNLETITGYRNILEIADSKSFEELNNVTAARSDLSASMDLSPDDPEVMRVTTQIVKIAKDRGKKTSVGGTITKANFFMIAEMAKPEQINSRHVIVSVNDVIEKNLTDVAEVMLSFEMDLFALLGQLKPEKAYYYNNRIELNRERIGKRKVLYSIR